MKTLLCAVDLTDSARPVLNVAGALARALRARLDLLHVVHVAPGVPPEYLTPEVVQSLRDGAAVLMEARASKLRRPGLEVRASIDLGLVDDCILKRARDQSVDLLVVGTHARHGAARLFLGSVAERLIRGAACPIAVVPPAAAAGRLAQGGVQDSPLKVVAGIDPSPASDAALAWLRALDREIACDLQLVHIYWPPREHERLGLDPPDPFAADPEAVAVLTRELRAHVVAHFGREDVPLRVRPSWGASDGQLTCEAEVDQADLLVVGTSQRRGSTAVATVRGARLPVVCVPSAGLERPDTQLAPIRAVLVTTDFSALGNAAVGEAYRLLLRGGGNVILLHVAEPGPSGLDPGRASEIETALLALVPKWIESHGIFTRAAVVADRSPADAIVKAIRRLGPDLVAMSSHGRGGVGRAVRGSVTEQVTRASARPVLVVPAGATSAEAEDDGI